MLRLSDHVIRQKPLAVIVGPTAVGKTEIALRLARHFGTGIITADSLQVYRGLDVATDKPSPADRASVPHRLIDVVDPDEPFNAGTFRRHAATAIEEFYAQGSLPLVVGGTGLYVRTLLKGLCEAPPADPSVRDALRRDAVQQGADALYGQLIAVDPALAATIHPRDTSKVIRALEVYRLTGRPLSVFHSRHRFSERPYRSMIIGLERSREALYRRIEERIDRQLAAGLVQETAQLLARGYGRDTCAMKGLGYRHAAAFLSGDWDYAEMVRRFKQDTRHFAKRQLTWFRHEPGIEWMRIEESDSCSQTADRIIALIRRYLADLQLMPGGTDQPRDVL